ncbi:hypothetical protein ABZ249_20090 [Nocardiopsis sp. NPDC006139]|uniref:hypothetical protein n=1 Tax=Nocardiopsis sp. NPDC006139 TaxID=3154578 RepID=UPI0033A76560
MAGASEGSDGERWERSEDIDDVDADMDVGAPDQDSAVAEYLLDHPHGLRIDEIEDRGSLGIGDELRREVAEQAPEPQDGTQDERAPAPRREDLARVLRAEEFAERLRERGV